MKEWIAAGIVLLMFLLISGGGCNRGDIQATPIIQGSPAPHEGYNVGPELWLEKGEPAKVTGAVIRIEGADPNDLFGD